IRDQSAGPGSGRVLRPRGARPVMTYTTYDANPFEGQTTTFTTLRIATDTSGSMRNIAISPDAIQVGVGKNPWCELGGFLTDRAVKADSGAYFSDWDMWTERTPINMDAYEVRITFRAVALISFDEP